MPNNKGNEKLSQMETWYVGNVFVYVRSAPHFGRLRRHKQTGLLRDRQSGRGYPRTPDNDLETTGVRLSCPILPGLRILVPRVGYQNIYFQG